MPQSPAKIAATRLTLFALLFFISGAFAQGEDSSKLNFDHSSTGFDLIGSDRVMPSESCYSQLNVNVDARQNSNSPVNQCCVSTLVNSTENTPVYTGLTILKQTRSKRKT